MPSGDDASGVASGIARRASTLGYVTNLMSFSHIFTSTAEAHMNSLPILGARHGTARAGLELARALKDLTPALAGKGAGNVVKARRMGSNRIAPSRRSSRGKFSGQRGLARALMVRGYIRLNKPQPDLRARRIGVHPDAGLIWRVVGNAYLYCIV